MNKTRAAASLWKQLLREYRAKSFVGKRVSEVYRAMKPGVTYAEFLHWLGDEDPVVPMHGNLIRLMTNLGYDSDLADFVYGAGVNHRRDRRTVYAYLTDLALSRLDVAYERMNSTVGNEEVNGITLEDITAVVRFEKVVKVELVDGR